MRPRLKKLVVATVVGLLLALFASPAVAFEPPRDPAAVFSCDGGPVAGHPGSAGQTTAMDTGNTTGAWNAHFNSEQIANCP